MKTMIKTLMMMWLVMCFAITQVGIAMTTAIIAISSNLSFVSGFCPLIGITNIVCTIYIGIRIYNAKLEWADGQKTIQREEDSANTVA